MASSDEPHGVRVRVTRDLGLFDVTMAAVGAMVGAAIFLLVGATFLVAGPLTLWSVVLAGLVVLLSGMAYAELGSGRRDASGGAYTWVRSALPAPSGFLAGWLSWGGHIAASALSALGIGAFLIESLRPIPEVPMGMPFEARWIGLFVLGVSALLHLVRFHVSVRALGRINLTRILLILFLAGIGIASLLVPGAPRGPGSVAADVTLVNLVLGAGIFFIAFQGFEVIAQLADQTKQPERTVPRGIFLAVGLALAIYLLVFVGILHNVPTPDLDGWPECVACGGTSLDIVLLGFGHFRLGEPWVREALLAVGIVSMYGALNANLTLAVRTAVGMARDGLLPRSLGRIRGREVPPLALAAGAAGAGVVLFLSLETIAILASLAFLVLFGFVHASVITIRRQERRSLPGFRVPLVPAVPILAIAVNLVVVFILVGYPAPPGGAGLAPGIVAGYLGVMWIGAGLILHFLSAGRRAARRPPAPARGELSDVIATHEEPVELERYRVFLPLREFGNHELVEFGARVAWAREGELSLLNVVEIPRNLPPKAIRFRYVDDRIRGLQKLARIGTKLGVDTRPVVKIGYKVYEIILDTVREEAVNLLVVGWRGARIEGDRRVLGSNIDYLIENAPCDVVVFKTHGMERPLQRIVILTSPIWSVRGIEDFVLVLAEADRPVIEVLGLAADVEEAERLKQEALPFLQRAQERGLTVEHKILYSVNWESMAIQESADASLLAIRASSPAGVRRSALNPIENRIVKLAKCPVLILRAEPT